MWDIWVQSLGWENHLEKGRLHSTVFWPGEFHGLYSPWGRKESDMTEQLHFQNGLEFNSDDHYIYYCGQESLRRNAVALIVNKRV